MTRFVLARGALRPSGGFERAVATLSAVAAILLGSTGCTGLILHVNRTTERLLHWQTERQEYREIEHQARMEALNAEQQSAAAAAAKAQNKQFAAQVSCEANTQRQTEALHEQVQESVRSRIGLDVDQQFQIGQLQVDTEKLKKLLDERKKLEDEQQKLVDEANKQLRDKYKAELNDYINRPRERLTACEPEPEVVVCPPPTCCCKPGCGPCGPCQVAACDPGPCCCTPRSTPCPSCQKKKAKKKGPCETELPPIPKAPLQDVAKAPLRAVDVPFMLPVTLSFGMDNPQIQNTSVRREPLMDIAPRPVREPLRENLLGPGGPCGSCQHSPCCCVPCPTVCVPAAPVCVPRMPACPPACNTPGVVHPHHAGYSGGEFAQPPPQVASNPNDDGPFTPADEGRRYPPPTPPANDVSDPAPEPPGPTAGIPPVREAEPVVYLRLPSSSQRR